MEIKKNNKPLTIGQKRNSILKELNEGQRKNRKIIIK